MKIRKGFVSNSSSSSFIVAFDRLPTTHEEMKIMLFGNKTLYQARWSTDQVSEIVWEDFCRQVAPMTYSQIVEASRGIVHIDYWNNKKYQNKNGDIDYELVNKDEEKLCKEKIDEFISNNKGKYYYEFDYADENGSLGSDMEHGDLFSNLSYVRISRH